MASEAESRTVQEMRSLAGLACIALLATVASCVDSGGDPTGRTWQLTELEGSTPLPATVIDLTVDSSQVSGSSGCNQYSGPVELDADAGSMTLGPNFATTQMACEQPIMDQERRYLELLTRVASFDVTDDSLILFDASGDDLAGFK